MPLSKRISIVLLCTTLGCTARTDNSADTSGVDTVNLVAPGETAPPAPGGASQSPTPAPSDTSQSSGGTSWTVNEYGIGPLRAGMTVAQASKAAGGGFAAPKGYTGGCNYAVLTKKPRGIAVMLESGKIARAEVRSGGIATAAGARIGDSESRINSLYAGRVTSTPHKYAQGGHYLTVRPSARADSAYRIVFETDGSKVTEYRSGRTPAVEYVERCG